MRTRAAPVVTDTAARLAPGHGFAFIRYPAGYLMHMAPRGGPDAWERPDKLAEPSYWRLREGEGAGEGGGEAGPPTWALYVGIDRELYGSALRLSRTMTVDHCQYSYDAALWQIVQQMR